MRNEQVVFNVEFLPISVGIKDDQALAEIYQEYLKYLDSILKVLQGPLHTSDQLYIAVHTLKSSSASVGAHMLAAMLRDFEHELLTKQTAIDDNSLAALVIACKQTHDVISGHLGSAASRT